MAKPHRFPSSHRLSGKQQFAAVYEAGVRQSRGPLSVYAIPNKLGHLRLGLSVSRRVGIAVRRNRLKRLLREAFRLLQHDLPTGYDIVVVARPHEPLILAEYQKLLMALLLRLHRTWQERAAGRPQSPPAGDSPTRKE